MTPPPNCRRPGPATPPLPPSSMPARTSRRPRTAPPQRRRPTAPGVATQRQAGRAAHTAPRRARLRRGQKRPAGHPARRIEAVDQARFVATPRLPGTHAAPEGRRQHPGCRLRPRATSTPIPTRASRTCQPRTNWRRRPSTRPTPRSKAAGTIVASFALHSPADPTARLRHAQAPRATAAAAGTAPRPVWHATRPNDHHAVGHGRAALLSPLRRSPAAGRRSKAGQACSSPRQDTRPTAVKRQSSSARMARRDCGHCGLLQSSTITCAHSTAAPPAGTSPARSGACRAAPNARPKSGRNSPRLDRPAAGAEAPRVHRACRPPRRCAWAGAHPR